MTSAIISHSVESLTLCEAEVNPLTYSMAGGARRATAVALSRLNAFVFPSSANVFDGHTPAQTLLQS